MLPHGAMFLFFFLSVFIACHAVGPRFDPTYKWTKLKKGLELKLTCYHSEGRKVKLYYPNYDRTKIKELNNTSGVYDILPSEFEIHNNSNSNLTFIRHSTVVGDTGWYGCLYENETILSKDWHDLESTWLYIYVTSTEWAFTPFDGSLDYITNGYLKSHGRVGNSITLPCRPTFPTAQVILKKNGKEIQKYHSRMPFDSKFGFTIKNSRYTDDANYTCEVYENGLSQKLDVKVFIENEDWLKIPSIEMDDLGYAAVGSTLNVKCRIGMREKDDYEISWETPLNLNSRNVTNRIEENRGSIKLVTSELIVNSVTYDDEGNYTCYVKGTLTVMSTNVYIKIYNKPYINLTTDENLIERDELDEFPPVIFTAHIDAHPPPTLKWYHPFGNEITMTPITWDDLYYVSNNATTSSLTIPKIVGYNAGNYTLEASNSAVVRRLTFELIQYSEVYISGTLDLHDYYNIGEDIRFFLTVYGNPKPTTSWTYTSCPTNKLDYGCKTSPVKGTEVGTPHPRIISETVLIKDLQTFGKIQFKACIKDKCSSKEKKILVTDGAPNKRVGIIKEKPNGKVYTGDDIKLVCTAVNYMYKSVEWTNAIEVPGKIHIAYESTNFTHRTILSINNIQKSYEREWKCTAKKIDVGNSYADYLLLLEDPVMPNFTQVNMNNTEVILSAEEAQNTIYLYCYAKGSPKPNITWYKNDAPLELSSQFRLVNNNQQLIIKYLLEKDSGKYSCRAKNRFGTINKFQKYIVKGIGITLLEISVLSWLIVIVVLILIYFFIKFRLIMLKKKKKLEAGLAYFEKGAPNLINPKLTVHDQAVLLPYDRKWEFASEKLEIEKQLGTGNFGVVMKAKAYGINADEPVTTVAIKMTHKNAESACTRALISELKIMAHLGKHLNIVNLLGACTRNIAEHELMIIVEYCELGNLQDYLLYHQNEFINQFAPISKQSIVKDSTKYSELAFSSSDSNKEPVIFNADTQNSSNLIEFDSELNWDDSQTNWSANYSSDFEDRNPKFICSQNLISWSFQVANGMEYLAQKKILHGDLAARNVLLSDNNIVKICDFGLAKLIYRYGYYRKVKGGPIPIKWAALESIKNGIFSTMSDIWGFGVLLWEIFSLAEVPYSNMDTQEMCQKLDKGYRMGRPKYANEYIYNIMLDCWNAKPDLRPSFSELVRIIGELLDDDVRAYFMKRNRKYENLNKLDTLKGEKNYLEMMAAPGDVRLAPSQHSYVNVTPLMSSQKHVTLD